MFQKYFQRMTKLQDKMWGFAKIGIKQWRVEHFCYKQTKKKCFKVFPEVDKVSSQDVGMCKNRNKTAGG